MSSTDRDDPSSRPLARRAKVGHRKTRTGCKRCRERRVKCDEALPVCRNCSRLGLDCVYAPQKTSQSPQRVSSATPNQLATTAMVSDRRRSHPQLRGSPSYGPLDNLARSTPENHLEGQEQRLMELRLLHNWMSRQTESFGLSPASTWRNIWRVKVPRMALGKEHVLYALMAFSASQLLGSNPDDMELSLARHTYWSMALAKQSEVVSHASPADTESLTLAAMLISMNAFAVLRDRNITPYSPPTQWLEVAKGVRNIFPPPESLEPDSTLRQIQDITANIWKDAFCASTPIDREYERILRTHPSAADSEDMETYEKTLAYLCSFRKAIIEGEPMYQHVRRICIFPQRVSRRFIELLYERRPRALVILACYFALASHSGALHLFGDFDRSIPKREVYAISQTVPAGWRGLMIWPLDETFGDGMVPGGYDMDGSFVQAGNEFNLR